MAQTGYTPILIYSSSTTTNAPAVGNLTNSTLGSELAINITDGKLFYKDNANAIQVIGWKVRPATAGGTGLTSFAVGDLLYADTTTTLAKLADVATGNALISGGVGVAPSWGKIGLTTHVSGILPLANGGTNNTTGAATAVTSNSTSGLMQITGPAAASTRVMTIPDANFTAARTDAAQSFTGNQSFLTSMVVGPDAKQANNGFEVNVKTAYSGFIGNTGFGVGGTPINPSTNYGLHIGYNRSNGNGESNLVWGSGAGALSDLVVAQWTGTTYSVHTTFKKGGQLNIANGNIEIGTSGKGIDFSAAGGDTLSTYDEGTWTPSDQSGAGLTFASADGWFVRVGREVFAHYYITYPATASAAANVIGGLPFTAGNTNAARGGSALTYNEFNAVTSIYGPKNTTLFALVDGNGNQKTNASMSGKTIMGCINYFL